MFSERLPVVLPIIADGIRSVAKAVHSVFEDSVNSLVDRINFMCKNHSNQNLNSAVMKAVD